MKPALFAEDEGPDEDTLYNVKTTFSKKPAFIGFRGKDAGVYYNPAERHGVKFNLTYKEANEAIRQMNHDIDRGLRSRRDYGPFVIEAIP